MSRFPFRLLALLLPLGAYAQEAPSSAAPAITLTGRSRLTSGYTSPLPASSSLPVRYARWEFDPSLAVYGVPVTAHLLLTTENDPARRAMNSLTLEFDVKAFQNMLRERVMAKAKSIETDFRAKAEEMRAKLSDPATVADLARFDELQGLDTAGALADSGKAELEKLRATTEEARAMARTAERYAKMDPAAMAKEKERELKKLAGELADPAKLEDKLEEMDLFSGADKFLFGVKDLGLGVTYPSYSPLVLTGVPVNGASLEYSYGILTVAGAGGSMNGPIPYGRIATDTFGRTLIAGKLGLGTTSGTHFHLIGLYAKDDPAGANPDSAYAPARNQVLAADGRLELFDRAITISGLVAGSMFTRDLNAPSIEIAAKNDPAGIFNKLDPRISTSLDYAWSLETAFNLFDGTTRGKITAQMIGPGYTSLGVPYLRADLLGQTAELDQSLLNGQLSLGGYYKRNQDNIVPWKRALVAGEWLPAQTTLTSYGMRGGVQFRGLPYLRVEYAPFVQQTDIEGDTVGADNRTTLVSASAGYGYQLLGLAGTTTATALSQTGTSLDGAYAFTNRVYILNQSVAFTFPLSLSAGGSYTETDVANEHTRIAAITASGSLKISEALKGTLGLTLSDRNDGGQRLGFVVRSTVKLWGYGELDLRAERNAYQSGEAADEDYDQLLFRGVLTTRW